MLNNSPKKPQLTENVTAFLPLAYEVTSVEKSEFIVKAIAEELTLTEMATLTSELIKFKMHFIIEKEKIRLAFGNPKALTHQLTAYIFKATNFPISFEAITKFIETPSLDKIENNVIPDDVVHLIFPIYQYVINSSNFKENLKLTNLKQQFLLELISSIKDVVAFAATQNTQNARELLVSHPNIFDDLKEQPHLLKKMEELYQFPSTITTSSNEIFNKEQDILLCYRSAVSDFNHDLDKAREKVWAEFIYFKGIFEELQQLVTPGSSEFKSVIQILKFIESFSKCEDVKSVQTKRDKLIIRINNACKFFDNCKDKNLNSILFELNTHALRLPENSKEKLKDLNKKRFYNQPKSNTTRSRDKRKSGIEYVTEDSPSFKEQFSVPNLIQKNSTTEISIARNSTPDILREKPNTDGDLKDSRHEPIHRHPTTTAKVPKKASSVSLPAGNPNVTTPFVPTTINITPPTNTASPIITTPKPPIAMSQKPVKNEKGGGSFLPFFKAGKDKDPKTKDQKEPTRVKITVPVIENLPQITHQMGNLNLKENPTPHPTTPNPNPTTPYLNPTLPHPHPNPNQPPPSASYNPVRKLN